MQTNQQSMQQEHISNQVQDGNYRKFKQIQDNQYKMVKKYDYNYQEGVFFNIVPVMRLGQGHFKGFMKPKTKFSTKITELLVRPDVLYTIKRIIEEQYQGSFVTVDHVKQNMKQIFEEYPLRTKNINSLKDFEEYIKEDNSDQQQQIQGIVQGEISPYLFPPYNDFKGYYYHPTLFVAMAKYDYPNINYEQNEATTFITSDIADRQESTFMEQRVEFEEETKENFEQLYKEQKELNQEIKAKYELDEQRYQEELKEKKKKVIRHQQKIKKHEEERKEFKAQLDKLQQTIDQSRSELQKFINEQTKSKSIQVTVNNYLYLNQTVNVNVIQNGQSVTQVQRAILVTETELFIDVKGLDPQPEYKGLLKDVIQPQNKIADGVYKKKICVYADSSSKQKNITQNHNYIKNRFNRQARDQCKFRVNQRKMTQNQHLTNENRPRYGSQITLKYHQIAPCARNFLTVISNGKETYRKALPVFEQNITQIQNFIQQQTNNDSYHMIENDQCKYAFVSFFREGVQTYAIVTQDDYELLKDSLNVYYVADSTEMFKKIKENYDYLYVQKNISDMSEDDENSYIEENGPCEAVVIQINFKKFNIDNAKFIETFQSKLNQRLDTEQVDKSKLLYMNIIRQSFITNDTDLSILMRNTFKTI